MSFDVYEWRTRLLNACSQYGDAAFKHGMAAEKTGEEWHVPAHEVRLAAYQRVIEIAHEVPYTTEPE